MAFQNTRQSFLLEDPGFNLGMDAGAFRNLGMENLANAQAEGLMGLPGANTTVANPAVVNVMAQQVSNPTTTAKDLFDYYATGFNPDQTALDFWNNKISTLGYEGTLNEFLNPKQGSAAPRFAAMQADPDFIKAGGQQVIDAIAKTAVPTIPDNEQRQAREVVDPDMSIGTGTTITGSTGPGLSLEDVYQQVLGRAPDVGGREFWAKEFGADVDPTELARFTAEAAPELQSKALFDKYVTGFDADQTAIDFWRQKLAAPGATYDSVLKEFLNPTDKNAPRTFLMQADPDYVAAQQAARGEVDTTNFPKFEGTPYDPKAYDTLVKQLTAQQQVLEKQAGFKYGSTFGGAQETIADMAKRLAAAGISDIRDFGQRYAMVAEKVYETVPGDEGGSMTFDTGKYQTITGIEGYDGDNNPIYKYRELTPSEVKRLKFDDEGVAFLDAKKEDIAENPFAESVYYNKKTGEIIDKRKFGGKAESGIWGSSGAGDGYTNYRVQYTKDGTPIFYPEKNLSGMKEFIAEDLSGIASVLRFIPGAQIPLMIAQAAAAAHMGAKPGDILKQIGTTLLASNLDKIAPAVFKQAGIDMPTTDLGKLAYSGGLGALQSLIQGGDLESALKSGALSAAGTGIRGLMPAVPEGELDYGKILTALAPALADGKLSNADVFRLLQAAVPKPDKKTPGKP